MSVESDHKIWENLVECAKKAKEEIENNKKATPHPESHE